MDMETYGLGYVHHMIHGTDNKLRRRSHIIYIHCEIYRDHIFTLFALHLYNAPLLLLLLLVYYHPAGWPGLAGSRHTPHQC